MKWPALQNPQAAAISPTVPSPSDSMRLALAIRSLMSSPWIERPSSAEKRRSSVARETPTAFASWTVLGGFSILPLSSSSAFRSTGLSTASMSVERRTAKPRQGTSIGTFFRRAGRCSSISLSRNAAASYPLRSRSSMTLESGTCWFSHRNVSLPIPSIAMSSGTRMPVSRHSASIRVASSSL